MPITQRQLRSVMLLLNKLQRHENTKIARGARGLYSQLSNEILWSSRIDRVDIGKLGFNPVIHNPDNKDSLAK